MNKFEQLIEYVINDDEAKARELFHDIVVEKSRAIYEEMMQEEEEIEEDMDEDLDAEAMEEGMMGGDAADKLIDDIEVEEEGISMEGEDDMDDMGGDDHHDDVGGDEELEDRVVDLEDKLDELMAEFESLMGGDDMGGDDMGDEEMDVEVSDEFDTPDMDSEEVVDDELETEGMYENVSLKAVSKPTHGDNGANNKSPVAANSGAKGMAAKPVRAGGDGGNGRPAPTAKDMGSTTQPNVKPAPKPHLAQAAGVNTKSVTN
jgi:hypothetical protein